MSNKYLDIAMEKVIKQEVNAVLDKIRAEIAEYKDDKVIHDERNEMIDIVLEIIDKYREPQESDLGDYPDAIIWTAYRHDKAKCH